MSNPPKKPGISLSINKLNPVPSKHTASVFGNGDSSSDEDEAVSRAQKFQAKFGNLKAKDERAVKKVLDENPDIYDYDGAYEEFQQKRVKVEEEDDTKKEVKKESKYIDRFMTAKKKRDLEKLLRDEKKQEKERAEEGDEFKDKDVFITSAYRKQLEETVKFRKELEQTDKIDEMTSVKDQKMWSANFGKKLLEDQIKSRYGGKGEEESSADQKTAIKTESMEQEPQTSASPTRKSTHESEHKDRKSHRSSESSTRRSRHDSEREEKKHRSAESPGRRSERDDERKHRPTDSASRKSFREAEREEKKQRMQAIRKILARRNTDEQIEAARHRYFERRNAGLVVPPA